MNDLYHRICEPCRQGAPLMSTRETERLKPQIPDWEILESQGIKKLQRTFKFKNFSQALAFTSKVGALAEEHDHHPAILTEWGKVCVTFWTHKVRGLHINDFIMAARTDLLT
ncbi:MAG: 4a-hydroxytetrahydrobiopterin dehydratase [Proteobacteria bacterium]|nr:4a-hydroxytetrahydrobiopterin dehydratase [Pseudomonadota bacterium]MBU1582806.1 4a-hydroxytetrahydrobiopterin dehydratase [Pseudomonadota bacterium]MBU2453504.1 4a-hydroxytetrahydrobiopterin dehydratase [Pseudomonadota bacterium]MBU2631617.1 4a-hydroxytetrahydrobiopterin dehydratase [Pseudomonadota bacterium]